MRGGELGPREAGRLAACLYVASGVLSAIALPLPQLPGIDRGAVLAVSATAVAVGAIASVLPWDRWPRRTTLVLLPIAFVVIALGNSFGSARSYSYSVFFIVAFVWLGVCHERWSSLWFAPLAAVAYVTPILWRGDHAAADAAAGALTIPVCVLVAEILARISASERRSRHTAQALLRVGSRLGPHLSEQSLCQSLADESRIALAAEHAILFRIDADTLTITSLFVSGMGSGLVGPLQLVIGQDVDLPLSVVEGAPLIVERAATSERPSDREMYERFGVKSYLAFPVMAASGITGLLSLWETTTPRRYTDGDLALAEGLAGQASAAFQNAWLYEQTLAASRNDSLTGLGNRRAFRERLEAEVERARRYERELSLVLIDADGFKAINDTFGHPGGDRALARLGELLRRSRRLEDGAFRIGGDEYALILPETGRRGATTIAERLRRRVEHASLGGERDIPLTVSVGVSTYGIDGSSADALFERADSALYDVKATGGNATALAAPTAGARCHLGVDIETIIDAEQLAPVYQPIFELACGTVMGFESFCRLEPHLGSTPTATLFRAAAAAGRLTVLDQLCRRIAVMGTGGLLFDALLFVNVTPAALEVDGFDPGEILDLLDRSGLSPDRVVIELTETERTPRSKSLCRSLRSCREAGLRVALDDFGAAGADLDLLAGNTFDYIKVDMSFVHGANGVDTRRRVLRGMAVLATEAGAQTIAEGIEDIEDLRLVHDLGFAAAQGFLLREPSDVLDHTPRPLLDVHDTVDVATHG